MFWQLFGLGVGGALLTLYLATQEVVPEFRPLFDTAEDEKEAERLKKRMLADERQIDAIEKELRQKETVSAARVERLSRSLDSAHRAIASVVEQLKPLQRRIAWSTLLRRLLGFAIYVLLGGFFAALLAEQVQISDLEGDTSKYISAFVIGATWMSYLSVLGFRSLTKTSEEETQAVAEEAEEELQDLENDLPTLIREQVQKALEPSQATEKEAAGAAAEVTEKVRAEVGARRQRVKNEAQSRRRSLRRKARSVL